MLERFLAALPIAASNGYAFVAYVLTLGASTYLAHRQRRLSLILTKIKDLPSKDRLPVIRLEMGAIEIPEGFTPEHFLAIKRMKYRLATLAVVGLCLIVIFSLAYVESGTISASVDLSPGN